MRNVLVCGHLGCGAVAAALDAPAADRGLVNLWVGELRELRDAHAATLRALPNREARWAALVELNVARQVLNVATAPAVRRAWAAGAPLAVHGAVFDPADGRLRPLTAPIAAPGDLEVAGGGGLGELAGEAAAHAAFDRDAA